jgi:hypothetical protein
MVKVGAAVLVVALGVLQCAVPAVRAADSTVFHTGPPAATSIGLIGDSTLSGVRWFEAYGALDRFSYVFDAESCRRTIERSCWSREQRRSDNAMTVLREYSGQWGEVLVMMTGYNDSAAGFGDAVEQIVAEAESQGIATVLWLTLRTDDVNYEEPLHLANGATYRDANRTLYAKAAALGGRLQLADWAGYTTGKSDWFESDGAHLTIDGARAVTTFIADQVDRVLAGQVVTPPSPPWEEIRAGDSGDEVQALQEALITSGAADADFVADGDFGPLTESAVRTLQQRSGLDETGVVDAATASALGLYSPPPPAVDQPAAVPVAVSVNVVESGGWSWRWTLFFLSLVGLAAGVLCRRRTGRAVRVSRSGPSVDQASAGPAAVPRPSNVAQRGADTTVQRPIGPSVGRVIGAGAPRTPTRSNHPVLSNRRRPHASGRGRAPQLDRRPPSKSTSPPR